MNYIKHLEQENRELKAQLARVNVEMFNFYAFLHSPKFVGSDSEGHRKDWIATSDIIHWLSDTRSLTT